MRYTGKSAGQRRRGRQDRYEAAGGRYRERDRYREQDRPRYRDRYEAAAGRRYRDGYEAAAGRRYRDGYGEAAGPGRRGQSGKLILLGALVFAGLLLAAGLFYLLKSRDSGSLPALYDHTSAIQLGGAGGADAFPKEAEIPEKAPEEVPEKTEPDIPYPNMCGLESVAKPEKRTREEVLARLYELGEGNRLIADIVQRESDYPEELMEALANNPEMADFASRWNGTVKNAAGGLTEAEMGQDFPLFLQWDPRWGYVEYGDGSCIGLAGCGPACLSMALYYLTGDESITPDKVGAYSMDNGCYISGVGTAWVLFETMPAEYGVLVAQPEASSGGMESALDDGAVIILSMAPGNFTAEGHFIVVYGYDEDGFLVNDPNCVARSRKKWAYSEFGAQIKNMWILSNKAFCAPGVDYAVDNPVEYYD